MASPPKDRYWLVWIIFCLLGMGCLLPLNIFISVSDYWMYKFRDVTDDTTNGELTQLQKKWNSYNSIASMVPRVPFLLINAAFGHRFRTYPRLFIATVVVIVMLILADVLSAMNTDNFQDVFFYTMIVSIVVTSSGVSVFRGALFGLAATFPPAYMNAFLQGQGLGGIFAATINVFIILLGDEPEDSAFFCFLITIMFILMTGFSFLIILTLNKFFRYYDLSLSPVACEDEDVLIRDDNKEDSNEASSTHDISGHGTSDADPDAIDNDGCHASSSSMNDISTVLQVTWTTKMWIGAVFFNFVVTLAVYPAITSLIKSTNAGSGNPWNDIYFTPVECILLYNVCYYVGCITAILCPFPTHETRGGGYIILSVSLVRVIFIPFFIFCNASPNNRVMSSVLIHSDAVYGVGMVLFAWSGSHFGTLCMMFGPKLLPDPQQQSIAASVMIAWLVMGLSVGAMLSSICVMLL